MQSYELIKGTLPILISMPHNGIEIPEDIGSRMTESALKVKDTDWYLDQLYDFAADMGCYLIKPYYSRYVIDLNRSKDNKNLYPGQNTTELCPTSQFDLSPIYKTACEPSSEEIQQRIKHYWQPYHTALRETIDEIKQTFGKCLLFEAHSIASQVPRFFEGQLPDFNFGNFDGRSSSKPLLDRIIEWPTGDYTKVVNERFKGGFITRHYGKPEKNIDAIQLELSQATYMDERKLDYNKAKAKEVQLQLVDLFNLFFKYLNLNH